MKNNYFKGIIGLLAVLFSLQSVAQAPNAVPKNKYGLQIISNASDYQQLISKDSNQQLVLLKNWVKPLVTEWKYATTDNFTHTILYKTPEAFALLPVAKALQKVQADLKIKGLSLKFFDAYRPYHVTEKMWEIVPDDRYAANPANGSGHNRGIAVDITLIDLKTGKELKMPTSFDDFTERAHHDYMQLDSITLANRALLKTTMEKYGFTALSTEWWHYFFKTPTPYALLDLDFKTLKRMKEICN
jgi:D-alanyl-D-alanine dipeptidase